MVIKKEKLLDIILENSESKFDGMPTMDTRLDELGVDSIGFFTLIFTKRDNDDKRQTVDAGDNCNVGVVDGGVGASCDFGDWKISTSCTQKGCATEVKNDSCYL